MPARAQVIADYASWQTVPVPGRAWFVLGALDRMTRFPGRDPFALSFAAAVRECLGRAKPTPEALQQGVTDAYEANPDLHGADAVSMLQYVYFRVCDPEITRHVQRAGEANIGAAGYLANVRRNAAR